MLVYPEDAHCLIKLRMLIDRGEDYRVLRPDFIQNCVQAARKHFENPAVCTPTEKLAFQPGQIVTFIYSNCDENTPWRFGVVNAWLTGAWNIYTFNLEWKREKSSSGKPIGRKIAIGPEYRSYSIQYIEHPRIITGKPIDTEPVPVTDLEAFLAAGRKLIDRIKHGD